MSDEKKSDITLHIPGEEPKKLGQGGQMKQGIVTVVIENDTDKKKEKE